MKLSSALITILLFSNINGMQDEKEQLELEEIASVKKKTRSKFLPMNNVRMMVPQLYYGGKPVIKKNKNTENEYVYGERVGMHEKDPVTHCSFAELAREQRKKGLPYILAVLTVQVMNNKYERRYQDAAGLVNWLYNIDNFAYING